jgi:hypothetical protein
MNIKDGMIVIDRDPKEFELVIEFLEIFKDPYIVFHIKMNVVNMKKMKNWKITGTRTLILGVLKILWN